MNRAVNAYSNVSMQTNTNKADILIQLYEGAIRFLEAAKDGMAQFDMAKKGEYISRVIDIITELDSALDRKAGGEIVESLSDLYSYMVRRLSKAGMENDPVLLDEVKTLLTTLLDAWKEASDQLTPRFAPVQNDFISSSLERPYGGVRFAF